MQSHEQLPVHQVRLRGGQVPKDTTRRAVLVAGRVRVRCSRIRIPNERAYEGGVMDKEGKPEIMIATVVGREAGGRRRAHLWIKTFGE